MAMVTMTAARVIRVGWNWPAPFTDCSETLSFWLNISVVGGVTVPEAPSVVVVAEAPEEVARTGSLLAAAGVVGEVASWAPPLALAFSWSEVPEEALLEESFPVVAPEALEASEAPEPSMPLEASEAPEPSVALEESAEPALVAEALLVEEEVFVAFSVVLVLVLVLVLVVVEALVVVSAAPDEEDPLSP